MGNKRKKVNNISNFGVTKKNLRAYTSQRSNNARDLECILNGAFVVDWPREVLEQQNTYDILAGCLGLGATLEGAPDLDYFVESDEGHILIPVDQTLNPDLSFANTISRLVHIGFDIPGPIRSMKRYSGDKKKSRGYVSHDRFLNARMDELPEEVQVYFKLALSSLPEFHYFGLKRNLDYLAMLVTRFHILQRTGNVPCEFKHYSSLKPGTYNGRVSLNYLYRNEDSQYRVSRIIHSEGIIHYKCVCKGYKSGGCKHVVGLHDLEKAGRLSQLPELGG